MPEGDTIFRAAQTLHRALAGHAVTGFDSVYPALTRVDVVGRTIERVTSRGKHLLMTFSGGLVLRTHMRMHGSWHLYRPGERWQQPRGAMRVLLTTDTFVAVGFDVPDAEFIPARALATHRQLGRLGPDLLAPDFDAEAAIQRLRAEGDTPIADAILNQRVLAGIGNVFKSEVLFAARVHPFTPTAHLSDDTLRRIVEVAGRQLRSNVEPRARRLSAAGGRRTTGSLHPSKGLWVYGRVGEPCRVCGQPIALDKRGQDARLTYWCTVCQP